MEYELVHLNLGLAKYPLDDKRMQSFWELEKLIYDLARSFQGFIRDPTAVFRFNLPKIAGSTLLRFGALCLCKKI